MGASLENTWSGLQCHCLGVLGMHIVHHSEHKGYQIFVPSTDIIGKQDMR